MKFFIIIILATLSLRVFAQDNVQMQMSDEMKKQLTVASVDVIDLSGFAMMAQVQTVAPAARVFVAHTAEAEIGAGAGGTWLNKIDVVDIAVDKIINIGNKVWDVVSKGTPITNYQASVGTAMPENIKSWQQLSGWQPPKSEKRVGIICKNLYGVEVARFVYNIILLYGGSYNGTGVYIGYAAVQPAELSTAYMYTLSAQAKVESVFNMGTTQDPKAGMVLSVTWTLSNVLTKTTQTQSYSLDGLGNISNL